MNIGNNTTRRISSSYWMGQDTFVVEFNREFTTSEPFDKGDYNVIMVEYHKDENKWVIYREYYNSDDEYIEQSDDDFTSDERTLYITMAQIEYNRICCDDSWDGIIVSDTYDKYDAFINFVIDYNANGDDRCDDGKANKVVACNQNITKMLKELNVNFK